MGDPSRPVILLPGGIMPIGPAYGALIAELGEAVDAHPKDLALYEAEAPPADWSLDMEVSGIDRLADEVGFDRFHLVGYSGGGAACLRYATVRADRLLSLAVMEPAFAGWGGMDPKERAHFERFGLIPTLPEADQLAAFQALQLAPGVPLPTPPPGSPPPWMAKRPAGIRAFLATFFASDLDHAALRRFERPVWFALGGRSHPDYYARMSSRLETILPDYRIEVFSDRHHFDPPHRIEPVRVAASLQSLWARAEDA